MAQPRSTGVGFALALLSAATFSTSGSFARSLTEAGWSPAAAVAARIIAATLILAVPTAIALRGRWASLRRNLSTVTVYGLVAVAGCQVFFFNAVQTLSVGVALLLEYLGTVLVVGWMWLRHGQRPRRLTMVGSVVAVLGLALVLDLAGDSRLDPVGVLWGLGAALGLATYFVLSGRSDPRLPAVAMATGGMGIGAVALLGAGAIAGAAGSTALPMHATFGEVDFAGLRTSWLVPVLGLSVVAAVIAYVAGIGAARNLGPKLASFVGLTEVVFAVLVAWLLLGELPTPIQLAGGVLIVAGIALVRVDDLRAPAAPDQAPASEIEALRDVVYSDGGALALDLPEGGTHR
jgi:drug/metabolite transporter (DMT)-like permease